jgi:hypothetical protein
MERRRAERWLTDDKNKAYFSVEGGEGKTALRDVSSGGVRGNFSVPLEVGSKLEGKLEFHYETINKVIPFHVVGEVLRVSQSDNQWDTAIKLSQLSLLKN